MAPSQQQQRQGLWPQLFDRSAPITVLRFPSPQKIYLWPLVAGLAWFLTLTILLLRWFSIGQPRYPGQVNPDIPFISDIGAFVLQPVFITGCAITGVSFAGTMFAVHHVRYSSNFFGLTDDKDWRQRMSLAALGLGLVAAACLTLLSVFDTFENNEEHRYLLMGTFGALAGSAVLTTVVWWDQIWGPAEFVGLRKWCLLNTFLVLAQAGIGLAFVTLLYMGHYRVCGFLEWTLTYIGSFWLLSFVGYTKFREGSIPRSQVVSVERQPLLGP